MPRAVDVRAVNVPAESVTTPLNPELAPERINLPLPDFVRPLEPVNAEEIVAVSPETVMMLVAALAPDKLMVPDEILIPFAPNVKPAATVTVPLTVGAILSVSKIIASVVDCDAPVVPPELVAKDVEDDAHDPDPPTQ